MEIVRRGGSYVVAVKPAGVDSEQGMAALLSEALELPPESIYCVHRLDLPASGLLVYGLQSAAAASLSRQLEEKLLQKTYYAVVSGRPEEEEGTYRDLLYHDRRNRKMFPVTRMRKGVQEAELSYRLLETVPGEGQELLSLVEIQLRTGRFHQIRSQFAGRKMPLVGDGKYGSRVRAPQLALFCHALCFLDPETGERVECRTTPPGTFPWNRFSRI